VDYAKKLKQLSDAAQSIGDYAILFGEYGSRINQDAPFLNAGDDGWNGVSQPRQEFVRTQALAR